MGNLVYETHSMRDPLLPFIYHRSFVVTQRHSLPNWHENIELLYCTGGKGYIQCGPEVFDFRCGDIFVVNADTPHCICSEGSVLYRCLIIDNSFCVSNGIPISTLHFQNSIRDTELNALFEAVSAAFDGYDPQNLCAAADIRYAVLGLLRALCTGYAVNKPRSTGSAANEHVKKAMTYIRKNISAAMTLDDIAAYAGISKYHLSREFKAFTGKTIVQTVNLLRCTEAKRLMEGGMRVSAAATSCGYENLSYFTRTFRSLFHALPSAFVNRSDNADHKFGANDALGEEVCY